MLEDNISNDEVYELLSSQTRREAIRYFNQNADVNYSIDEVVDHLHDKTEESVDDLEVKLHHTDLPKLEDANVLFYESEKKEIVYLGDEELEESVDLLE